MKATTLSCGAQDRQTKYVELVAILDIYVRDRKTEVKSKHASASSGFYYSKKTL